MKIICQRESFLAAFQAAASVVPSRTPKPSLQSVLLEATPQGTTLVATDTEVGIRIDVPDVELETAGSVLLPSARTGAILREGNDDRIRMEKTDQGILIRGERSRFTLPAIDLEEFPGLPDFQEERHLEVPARFFRQLIHRTVFATDNESSRYALGGVLLELKADGVVGVSTDGRRLAKMEGPARGVGFAAEGDSTTIIVPARAMQLMERVLTDDDGEVRLFPRANDVLIRTGRLVVYARLVEGRFPRWRDVIPDDHDMQCIGLTVDQVFAAVRQAAVLASDDSRGLDLAFADGSLTCQASSADKGESEVQIPVAYDGPKLEVSLDHRFLTDFFKVLPLDKQFIWGMSDPDSPVLLRTDDGYNYVVMPLARDRGRYR